MGMIHKFNNWIRSRFPGVAYTTYIYNGMPTPYSDDKPSLLNDGYLSNESVYSIVNKIATIASSIPIYVVDKDGKEIKNHWLNDILNRPNNYTSLPELLRSVAIYKYSVGDAYLYKPTLEEGINKGKTKQIYLLPADQVEIVLGDSIEEPIKGYKMISQDTEREFAAEDVLHIKFFNPEYSDTNWNLYGLSPVKVASDIIRAQNSGNTAVNSAYANGSPPYLLSAKSDQGWTPDQQERVEQKHKQKYGTPENFGKPMILGSPVDVKMLGLSPVDLGILEHSKHSLRILCNVMGNVPSVLFNDNETSTYNNLKEAEKALYQNVIIPHNNDLAQQLTWWLLSGEKGNKIVFDYSDIAALQDDISTKITSLVNAYWLTPNEKREAINYERLNDIEMDKIYFPFNLQASNNFSAIKSDKVIDYLNDYTTRR